MGIYLNSGAEALREARRSRTYVDNAQTALVMIAVNVAMLVFVWPGFFQADHQATIVGIIVGQPSEWHSLLWGYLALPFLYLTPSYGFYGCVQIAIFVAAVTFSISRLVSLGVVGKGGRIALTAAYALTPTFLLYNMLWSSDVVFAIVLIPLTAMFIEIAKSRGECFKRISFAVGFALLLLFAIELRKNALLIFVCAIPLLLLRYKSARKTVLTIAACVLVGALALSLFFSAVCGAEKSPSQEMLSIPAQQIARTICTDGEIPDPVADILYSIRDKDEWAALYTNYSADSEKAGLSLTFEFLYAWFLVGVENPESYFQAYIELLGSFYSSFIECDFDVCDSIGIDVANYDTYSQTHFDASVSQDYQSQFTGEKNNANIIGLSFVGFLRSGSMIAEAVVFLFFNRALPLWVLLLCALAAAFSRKGMLDYLTIALPALCVLASLLLFSPVALFRYSMEIYYCLPLVVAGILHISSFGVKWAEQPKRRW